MTTYLCCDQNRRTLVRASSVNGIDWIDVVDLDAPTPALRQRELRVGFVNSPPPAGLTAANIQITGGQRGYVVSADTVTYDGNVLVVHLTAYGDFSPYVFALVDADGSPLPGLDPRLACISFNFKVECPTDIDCRPVSTCAAPRPPLPPIDYLAKDYPTFRKVMLDRMSVTASNWTERNVADIGVAMVELHAYVADYLSYQQDAVATEAYLGTARRRVSLRRHAKLVDYAMHDGCNARAWVVLTVDGTADGKTLAGPQTTSYPPQGGTLLLTRVQNDLIVDADERAIALSASPTCFETMSDLVLFSALNQLTIYTWGDAQCCLPAGATSVTIVAPAGSPDLRGRVILFQELVSPTTGTATDADVSHRQAVRITTMSPVPGAPPTLDPVTGVSIVELTWDVADALTFPLCISAVTDAAHGSQTLPAVSAAWGNVVLVDQGLTQPDETLGTVPSPSLYTVAPPSADRCSPGAPNAIAARFNPPLANAPLTQQGHVPVFTTFEGEVEESTTAFDPTGPASAAMAWDIAATVPAITLVSMGPGGTNGWTARRDLLESNETASDFVVEVDSDAIARVRFGDDEYGMRPAAGDVMHAVYRVGNGAAGNVGAGTIAHLVAPNAGGAPLPPGVTRVFNPLPAQGGIDPETNESVRRAAPAAFLVQERAVTSADYAAVALRNPLVSAAAAAFRWTGSWSTVFDTVDRPGGLTVDAPFEDEILDYLERYRVIGHDLDVKGPSSIPLRIDMTVCVQAPWFRADIEQELRQLFGTGILANGSLAFFNPDRHTFGETLYLSPLYALAQSVTGVESVEISRFERLYQPSSDGLTRWRLVFSPIEIPRCDNNPNDPGLGVFNLTVRGGQ